MRGPVVQTFSQSVYVSVAHRYWQTTLSELENRGLYGLDASSIGIGSNMRLVLEVECAAASVRAPDLRAALAQLKGALDHRCLFARGEPFSARPSTLEAIALSLAESLFQSRPAGESSWRSLTVWEHDNLGCQCRPNQTEVQLEWRLPQLSLILRGAVDPASGLAFSRANLLQVSQAVLRSSGLARPDDLWVALKRALPALVQLRIDISRHEYLTVASTS